MNIINSLSLGIDDGFTLPYGLEILLLDGVPESSIYKLTPEAGHSSSHHLFLLIAECLNVMWNKCDTCGNPVTLIVTYFVILLKRIVILVLVLELSYNALSSISLGRATLEKDIEVLNILPGVDVEAECNEPLYKLS